MSLKIGVHKHENCDPVNINRDWYLEYYVSMRDENFKDRMENFNAGNKVQQL